MFTMVTVYLPLDYSQDFVIWHVVFASVSLAGMSAYIVYYNSYTIQYTLYTKSIQCIVYTVQYTLYTKSIQCIVYTV